MIRLTERQVVRLWLHRQGLLGTAFTDHLERTGGLPLDGVNVLDRAHYPTLPGASWRCAWRVGTSRGARGRGISRGSPASPGRAART